MSNNFNRSDNINCLVSLLMLPLKRMFENFLVLAALGTLKFIQIQSSKDCVLFLKFHKVASATVGKILKSSKGDAWWKHSMKCGWSPFHEHQSLQLFRNSRDSEEILTNCIKPEIRNCSNLHITAGLREPVERVVSQFYSFTPELHGTVPHLSNTTIKMLQDAPRNVTAEDMKILLNDIQSKFNDKVKNDPWQNLNLYEYLYTLGKINTTKGLVNYVETEEKNEFHLQIALETLRREVTTVGLMEYLHSYFFLLSKHLDVDLLSTCHEHNDHGKHLVNRKHFGSSRRPAAEILFNKDVIEVLYNFTKYERRIWEEAKLVHIEQLKKFNLTIETAESYWNLVCLKN